MLKFNDCWLTLITTDSYFSIWQQRNAAIQYILIYLNMCEYEYLVLPLHQCGGGGV